MGKRKANDRNGVVRSNGAAAPNADRASASATLGSTTGTPVEEDCSKVSGKGWTRLTVSCASFPVGLILLLLILILLYNSSCASANLFSRQDSTTLDFQLLSRVFIKSICEVLM